MDVTLGVSVAGTDARIALLDAAPPHAVIDQSEIDLTGQPVGTLASTLVSTDRALTEGGHRLVGTRVCSSDPEQAAELMAALVAADLADVSMVSRPDAVSAVARSLTPGETVASLSSDADTAALSIVDAGSETTSLIAVEPIQGSDRAGAYRALLERFSEEPGGATSVIVMGGGADTAVLTTALADTSPVPLRFPDAPDFALARGAAMAGFRQQLAAEPVSSYPGLNSADTVLGAQSQQLAYSQVDDGEDGVLAGVDVPMQTPMRPLSAIDPDEIEPEPNASARPRVLLLGSTVAAIVVVGFAALAVSVAISIRPTASEQAIRMQEESLPGKYFPVSPGQGVNKDGENWTMVEQLPPPGDDTGVRTFETKPLNLSNARVNAAPPQVIQVFRDGTVGVQAPPTVTPVGPLPVDNIGAQGIPDFVPRLIPDFSKVNMSQVLNFVSNLATVTQRASDGLTTPLNQLTSATDKRSLTDFGQMVAVSKTRGELFDTGSGKGTFPGKDSIPVEVFQTSKDELGPASRVLPPDTTLIEALPPVTDTGKPGRTSLFDTVITDPGVLAQKPESSQPEAGGTTPIQSGSTPALNTTEPIQGFPLPGVDGTLPEQSSPLPDPGGIAVQPPVREPIEKPVEKPIERPQVADSQPELPIEAPDPQPEAPVAVDPAPQVSEPEAPVVTRPKPLIELPKLFPTREAPVQQAPVEQAPVEQAPVETTTQAPTSPTLPFGGLFGQG